MLRVKQRLLRALTFWAIIAGTSQVVHLKNLGSTLRTWPSCCGLVHYALVLAMIPVQIDFVISAALLDHFGHSLHNSSM